MKPIILVEVDGYFKLNKEQLDEMLKDAYEEGKKDGSYSDCNHCYWYLRPYRWSYSPWWPQITCTSGTVTTGASTTTDSSTVTAKPTYTTYTTDTTSTFDPDLRRKKDE